jgi:hypothetical protein
VEASEMRPQRIRAKERNSFKRHDGSLVSWTGSEDASELTSRSFLLLVEVTPDAHSFTSRSGSFCRGLTYVSEAILAKHCASVTVELSSDHPNSPSDPGVCGV